MPDGAGTTWTFGHNPAGQIVGNARVNDAYAWTGHYAVDRAYTTNGLNQYTRPPRRRRRPADVRLRRQRQPHGRRQPRLRLRRREPAGRQLRTGVTLRYDPLGRLFQVGGGRRGTTRFLYDGDALVAEYDARRHAAAPLRPRRRRRRAAVLVRRRRRSAPTAATCFADHQGSIVAVDRLAGNRLAINAYDEYGIPGADQCRPVPVYRPGLARPSSACITTRPGSTRRRWGGSCRPIRSGMTTSSISTPMSGTIRSITPIRRDCFKPIHALVSAAQPVLEATKLHPHRPSASNEDFHRVDQLSGQGVSQNAAWDSHDYVIGPFFICIDTARCRFVIRDVFPSYIVPDLGQPVVDRQISPVYIWPEGGPIAGHVQTRISPDGLSATNFTRSDHILRVGRVDISNRLIGGSWYVGARGYGSNFPGVGLFNQVVGPDIFRGMLGNYVMVVRSRLRN